MLSPLGQLVQKAVILPLYGTGVIFRLRIRRFSLPTRGAVFFLVGSRYLFHAVLLVAVGFTTFLNLRTPQAHAQDVGHSSLLYALATRSSLEIIQEDAVGDPTTPKTSYLGAETIVAVPHIDFNYDDDAQMLASLTVPGTIQAPPLFDAEGESKAPRTKIEGYVVQQGDTIGSIARDFRVNVGTILWSNGLTERQYIRPGDTLRIPPVSGVLVKVKSGDTIARLATRYEAAEEEIVSFNKLRDESVLAVGTELMIPGGKPPSIVPTIAIARRPAETVPANAPRPPAASPGTGGAALLWPTPGHVITQYYGWRHTGLDIDGTLASPLYAAEEGRVSTAGWNSSGYGLQVVITHANGMTTRYAHASKLYVKVGDYVSRGETIAMMGSTGRSTGSHLHFEVYVNGQRQNPLRYIR